MNSQKSRAILNYNLLNELKSFFYSSPLHFAAAMSGNSQDAIKLLVQLGAYINAVNDDLHSPLFMSVKANNPLAAATLIELNADYKLADNQGMTAFDSVKDISEWIRSEIFDKNFMSVLKSKLSILIKEMILVFSKLLFFPKGYEYKQTRNLIRSISSKINNDFSSNAMLIRRDRTITNYINEHYTMLLNFEKNRNSMNFFCSPRNIQIPDTKKTLINLNFTAYGK